MKLSLAPLLCALTIFLGSALHAEDARVAAVQAADDARVQAFKAPDREALTAIFAEDLHYAHSNGVVDTKAGFIDILTSGKTKYAKYDYQERKFSFPAPGIALMTGQVAIKAITAKGEMESTLSYLGVWKEVNGKWTFLAWQSCKLPATEAK